jgi:hypothetical protein
MSNEVLGVQVESAARVSTGVGERAAGGATRQFVLALAGEPGKTQLLELSDGFEFGRGDLMDGVKTYLVEAAKRLHNPRPDCYLTLGGLPLSFGRFGWPFHESTSGADTSLVHGEVRLEDGTNLAGTESVLHAKVAASMTVTFRDIVLAPEQPFAEGFIYNAVRKTMDQGQLELVKSGNRQPVPVTTRYYSTRQKKFVFNDTSALQRKDFLAGKLYWLSGVLGAGAAVWVLDPRDAQYLNTTVEALRASAAALEAEGLLTLSTDPEFALPTAALMARADDYTAALAGTLQFIKPSFNEDMRAGLTNM